MSHDLELPPTPQVLLESLRNTGYTLKSAIADIVDNSITAEAKNISIQFRGYYNNANPWVAICDDGYGMDANTLFSSMKFGSRDITEPRRGEIDLGRFGLGLKTASISQCRKLTVFSWRKRECHAFCWDLDKITTAWNIISYTAEEIVNNSILKEIQEALSFDLIDHGTVVLWEKLDRDTTKQDSHIVHAMNDVRDHLAEVFHRFMQKEQGFPNVIKFDLNGNIIEPAPPFGPSDNKNRHILHGDSFVCDGYTVVYQPYLLPRSVNYVNPADYTRYGGKEGYQQNQGFYIYRNRRLIEKATWFKKKKKEYKTQLLRIRLDIPAELDSSWGIDVRKSQLNPPEEIQKRVVSIVEAAMDEARSLWDSGSKNVHTLRYHLEPTWIVQARPDKWSLYSYKVNTSHGMYKLIAEKLSSEERKLFKEYLNTLAENFPFDRYYSDRNQHADIKIEQDIDNESRLADYINTLCSVGCSEAQIKLILQSSETSFSPELINQYLQAKFNN